MSLTADRHYRHRAAQLNILSCDRRMAKEPIISNFGKIVDSIRILVKTQKLATTCIADHSGKSRVVQAC